MYSQPRRSSTAIAGAAKNHGSSSSRWLIASGLANVRPPSRETVYSIR